MRTDIVIREYGVPGPDHEALPRSIAVMPFEATSISGPEVFQQAFEYHLRCHYLSPRPVATPIRRIAT